MVGLLGCGCECGGGGGGGGPPTGCGVCDGIYFGFAADREPFEDDFSSVDPRWQFMGGEYQGGPTTPVAPNAITDYIRDGRLHAFKSPFIVWQDPPFWFGGTRAVPPVPVPDTTQWRQPWLWVRRRHDLYFPSPALRKYSFAVNVNYPQNTLPLIHGQSYVGPMMGPLLRVWIGGPENRSPLTEFFSFTVAAQGLSPATDIHPNASLGVGVSQINPQRNDFYNQTSTPFFKTTTTVPWGLVRLRMDITWSPISKSGIKESFVNDTLVLTETFAGQAGPSIPGANCDSFCNFIVDIDCVEPWALYPKGVGYIGLPPIWHRGQYGGFARGPSLVYPTQLMSFECVTWLASNSPQDRLWFDDYSFSWSTVGGPSPL
jgi:hypothetical protein